MKPSVWALSWEEVLDRSGRALKDLGLGGVKTTIPFHQRILQVPEFRAGRFDTSFIENHPELLDYSVQRPAQEMAAAFAAAIAAHLGY